MQGNISLRLGDQVELRKTHPCGGRVWAVIRVGADIKLKCETCGHIVMLERAKAVKAIKQVLTSSV